MYQKLFVKAWLACTILFGFLLMAGSSAMADETTAAQKLAEGRAYLAQHDIPSATESFRQAVAAAEPGDQSFEPANLFYGVTRILNVAYSDEANALLDSTGASETGRNLYDWQVEFPEDAQGDLVLPSDCPHSTEYINFLANVLVPEIDASLRDNLSKLSSTVKVMLTPEEAGTDEEIEVDYGDVLMFKYCLYATESITSILKSYDLDVDVDEILPPLINGYQFSINNDLLAVYPDFLKLLTPNQMASAGDALRLSLNTYLQASDFIRAETDDQEDDLISFDPDSLEDEQEYRDLMEDLLGALSAPTQIGNGDEEPPLVLYLHPFFDTPLNLRDYLPAFDDDNHIISCSFPFPALGGVVPGYTNDDWNNLLGLKVPVQGSITSELPASGTVYVESFEDYWDGHFSGMTDSTVATGSGNYTLEIKAGSTVWVRAWSDEDGNGMLNPGDIGGMALESPVEVNSTDCAHSGVDILLDTEVTGVWGRVTDSSGNPIPGIYVSALRMTEDSDWCEYLNIGSATDENGMFALNGIPAGMQVKLQINAIYYGYEDGYWNEGRLTESCTEATSYTSGGAGTARIDIELQHASSISGMVMDLDGIPLPFSWVTVFDAASEEYLGGGNSDDYGYYSFHFRNAPSGQIKVRAEGEWDSGYIPLYYNNRMDFDTADAIVAGNGSSINGIDFYLPIGGVISGSALYLDNLPAAGVSVNIYDAHDFAWVASSNTSASGYYEAKGLIPGDYIVMFSNYKVNGYWTYTYFDNVQSETDATIINLGYQEYRSAIDLAIPAYLCDIDKNGSFDTDDMRIFVSDFGENRTSDADFDNDYDIDGMDIYRMALSISRLE